jgi:hypothetical protein
MKTAKRPKSKAKLTAERSSASAQSAAAPDPERAESIAWRNRIVGHADVSPNEVIAHDANWRTHPAAQNEALITAIKRLGVIKSITVNKRTSRIIDGHARVALAIREGQASLPVEYVDLTDAEEREALATIDPLAMMAGVDEAALTALSDSIALPEISGYGGLLEKLESLVIDDANGESNEDGATGSGAGSGSGEAKEQFKIVVTCASEREQCRLLKKFAEMDLDCRALLS